MNEQKITIEESSDGKIAVGGVLNEQQVEALGSITPSADDILNNMDKYNEELEDTYGEPVEVKEEEVREIKTSGKRRRAKQAKQINKTEETKKVSKRRKISKETKMDLDKELENMEAKMSGEAQLEDMQAPMDMKSQIMDLLNQSDDAPSEQQIAQWKASFGQNAVHVMALGEGDVYVFTHLKRGQWKKIQEMMAKIQESGQSNDMEDELKEKVLQHCCLWPKLSVEFFYNSRAGVADSLYQVILLNSYFLSPQQAMLLTTQL